MDLHISKQRNLYTIDIDDFASETTRRLHESWKIAKMNVKQAQETQKRNYDKSANDIVLSVGDKVGKYQPIVKPGLSPKLTSYWKGPYEVLIINYPNCLIRPLTTDVGKNEWIHVNRLANLTKTVRFSENPL